MTRIVFTTATLLALGLAAPAAAQDQLARGAGLDGDAGYTRAELLRLNHALATDDRDTVAFITEGEANVDGLTATARAFSVRAAEQGDDETLADAVRSPAVAVDPARDFAIRYARQQGDYDLADRLEAGESLTVVR